MKEIDELKSAVLNMKQKIEDQEKANNQLHSQVNLLTKQLKDHDKTIKKFKEENSGPLTIVFNSESSPGGILNKLQSEVTIKAGGKHDPQHLLSSLITFDDDEYFINSFNYKPKSIVDVFIQFDFGPTKRVDPISYFIKSGNISAFQKHPRSWTIDASNDGSIWKVIDKRFDDSTLRGDIYTGLFKIKNTIVNSGTKGFRYIRFIQNNSWMNGHPYMINLTYFEIYGFIYDSDIQGGLFFPN